MILFGKESDEDILNYNKMGDADKKLHMITQINTRINKVCNDRSEHYANTCIYFFNFSLSRNLWIWI
jgi:hypothetical protein